MVTAGVSDAEIDMPWLETHHPDLDAMYKTLSAELVLVINDAIAKRGHAWLALAGGRTPLPLYRALAEHALNWSAVTLVPTDERWVDFADSARNGRDLEQAFAAAHGVRVLKLAPDVLTGAPDAAFACAELAKYPQPFDLVLLGMGLDGHFASLFPGARELVRGLDLRSADDALVVEPNPRPADAPFARISLTLKRLLHAHIRWLLISGTPKLAVLARAKGQVSNDVLPISATLKDPNRKLEIHWSAH